MNRRLAPGIEALIVLQASWTLALGVATGCATPQEDGRLSETSVLGFAKEFEAAIVAGDWQKVRRSFLPEAVVIFQTSTDPVQRRLSPEAWVSWASSATEQMGYSRRREFLVVEQREDGDGFVVRSLVVEHVLGPGVRIEMHTKELMHVTQYEGTIGIGVLGVFASKEDSLPL